MAVTDLRYRASGLYGVGKAAALTGRPYVGLFAGETDLQAWRYLGGTYDSMIAQVEKGDSQSVPRIALVNTFAPLVVVWQSLDAAKKLYVWNISTNGLVTINRTPGSLHGGAAYTVGHPLFGRDGFFYWAEYDAEEQLFWLMRGGMGGGVEQITDEADGEVTSPTEFSNNFGGFLSRDDGALLIPNWGGGTEAASGYIKLPLNGEAAERVVDLDWLPFDADRSEWQAYWEQGHACARGPALVLFDGPSAERILYKVSLEGGVEQIVGAAHGLGDLTGVLNWSESPGGELILYANDAGVRQIARVNRDGIEDPPTETITWTTVEAGPNGSRPHFMFALD